MSIPKPGEPNGKCASHRGRRRTKARKISKTSHDTLVGKPTGLRKMGHEELFVYCSQRCDRPEEQVDVSPKTLGKTDRVSTVSLLDGKPTCLWGARETWYYCHHNGIASI